MIRFVLIFGIYLILLAYTTNVFFPLHFVSQNLFFFGLIGYEFYFPAWAYYFFSIAGFLIFSFIALKSFNKYGYTLMIVFVLSFWFHYLTVFQSFYMYLLFLVEAVISLVILMKSKYKKIAGRIFILTVLILIYSSLPFAIVSPFFLLVLLMLKIINRKIFLIIFLGLLPLIWVSVQHKNALDNIFTNQIKIFSNPGIMGEVNRLQGDSKKKGYLLESKLTENKYVYLGRFVLLRTLKQFSISTYFTSQEKMVNFSFTPPVLFGFLAPFIYGVYFIFKNPNLRKYILILPFFVIPSVFGEKIVDLNRLVIIGPVIIFFVGLGLMKLKKLIFIIVFTLVILQLVFTISDMHSKELLRYSKYFGENAFNEIGRQ